MQVVRWGVLALGCALILSVSGGCRRQAPSSFDGNVAPETYVTGAPSESTTAFYRVHLFWNGADPDGVVDYYEFSVTDTTKTPGQDSPTFDGFFRTERTDSLFVLSADDPQILGHRFYVRAVDNEGKADPTPAWVYFVAEDFNVPTVYFLSASGSWTDSNGQRNTIQINSNNEFSPTDTIGVGGAVSFSWCGYDLDMGPLNPSAPCRPQDLLGFVYRGPGDVNFRGGSLADTTFAKSLALAPGRSFQDFFSGAYALQVAAIDEAGARTNPAAARAVVVNFSPRAFIVDPDQVSPPVRKPVFKDTDTQQVWDSGTFLSDDFAGNRTNIEFLFTGLDDPRDSVVVPSIPTGITGFGYRKLVGSQGPDGPKNGVAYRELTSWKQHPEVSNFTIPEARGLTSGDYDFLVRARDVLGRWGEADRVSLSVNYFPYFVSVEYADTDTTYAPLWNPGGPQETITLTRDQFGLYPDVEIRALARDTHQVPPSKDPLDPNPVVEAELGEVLEYRMILNGERIGFTTITPGDPISRFYPVSETGGVAALVAGTNRLSLVAKDDGDNGGRKTALEVTFQVVLQ